MDEEALCIYEYMVTLDYWPEIIIKEGKLNNIFFISNHDKIIQYFIEYIKNNISN